MGIDAIVTQLVAGLFSASFLFLCATGFSLLFGAGNFFNFAHGSFFMLGGFLAYSVGEGSELPFFAVVVASTVGVTAISAIIFGAFLRRISRRQIPLESQILVTFGCLLIIGDVCRMVWGADFVTLSGVSGVSETIEVLGLALSAYQIQIIITTVVVGACLVYALQHSTFGMIVHAAASDPKLLTHLGQNPSVIVGTLFVIGAGLAGFGGSLFVPMLTVTSSTGTEVIVSAIVVTVIGGRGNTAGAALAAVTIGEGTALTNLFMPVASPLVPYLLGIAVLIVRPQGLLRPVVDDRSLLRV